MVTDPVPGDQHVPVLQLLVVAADDGERRRLVDVVEVVCRGEGLQEGQGAVHQAAVHHGEVVGHGGQRVGVLEDVRQLLLGVHVGDGPVPAAVSLLRGHDGEIRGFVRVFLGLRDGLDLELDRLRSDSHDTTVLVLLDICSI